jgi:EAL domain-containing protein (putative c-di-GMP-specific phosphodiesterase class I)
MQHFKQRSAQKLARVQAQQNHIFRINFHCANLGLQVIAEGVESPAQETFLRAENCEEVQGFFYAKPLPPGEFEQLLRANQARSQRDKSSRSLLTG